MLHISGTIHHMLSFMGQMCKIIISPSAFLNFRILIFRAVMGLKGQKITQNDKNLCQSHLTFQKPYIMMFIYGTHVCVKG